MGIFWVAEQRKWSWSQSCFFQRNVLSLLVFCWWFKQTYIGIYCLYKSKCKLLGALIQRCMHRSGAIPNAIRAGGGGCETEIHKSNQTCHQSTNMHKQQTKRQKEIVLPESNHIKTKDIFHFLTHETSLNSPHLIFYSSFSLKGFLQIQQH